MVGCDGGELMNITIKASKQIKSKGYLVANLFLTVSTCMMLVS